MRAFIKMFVVTGLVLAAGVAAGQDFPNRTIRIITGEAGGGNDAVARLVAQGLSTSLGQPVVVENRGGNGIIPAQMLVQANPDGYTLLLYGGAIWLLPLLQSNVPYDPLKDFAPVTLVAISPNVMVVPPTLPVSSVKEFIALAKATPGKLNFGTSGVGSANHLAGELFKSMAGVDIVHVPYKGTGAALSDLLAERIQISFPSAASVTPFVKSGRLKALAVTSAQPTTLFPDLPTGAAAGVPGYEAVSFFAIFAPANTPAHIISLLNKEIVKVQSQPEVKERLFNAGVEVVGSTPEQLTATMNADIARMGKVIKEAGIRAQ